LGRLGAGWIDTAHAALVDQARINRVDDLLGESGFRQALLVSTLPPVVLDVAVVAPEVAPCPNIRAS
jgi:hypothetical protein